MRMSLSAAAVPVVLAGMLQAPSPADRPLQSSVACPATEQSVLEVEHEVWSAVRNRDIPALDHLIDDRFLSTDDGGLRAGKKELLAKYRQPEGSIHNDTDEHPADVRLVFVNGVAILNFTKHWIDYDRNAGISFGATSVITRVLTCESGQWRVVAFHETGVPNRNRQPVKAASDHLDDYVGRYRFGENGDKGEISV